MLHRFFIFFLILSSGRVFAGNDYLITDYGAIGDGKTLCTVAIQKAINDANSKGGGRVVFPKGKFVSGTVYLKSNVSIFLTKKSTLLGSLNPKDYRKNERWKALILADRASNISLQGSGKIDGRGSRLALNIDSLFHHGQIDSSDYNFVEMRPKYYLRPQLIYLFQCTNISVSGITLMNSSCWVQTYENCDTLTVEDVTVDSDAYWNNDGIDIVDTKNVIIRGCDINCADDGICLKTEGVKVGFFCENILVEQCKVRSSASALKLGTSSRNDMKNIVFRNIRVYDTYRSAIAIEAMQGGTLEDITFKNIKAKNTGNAIFLRIGRIRNAPNNGILKNVKIQNVKVKVPFKHPDYDYTIRGPELPFFHNVFPSSITGIPNQKIENVVIEDVKIVYPGRGSRAYANMPLYRLDDVPELITKYPEFSMFGELPAWGFYVRHVDGIEFKDIQLKIKDPDYRVAFVYDDTSDIKMKNVKIKGDEKDKKTHLYNSSYKK